MVVAGAEAGFAVVAAVCANALPITKVVAMRVAISLFMLKPVLISHRQFLCPSITPAFAIGLT